MKRLGLLRHAKSEDYLPRGRDFDRGLNDKGRRAAKVMGAHLGKEIDAFDMVVGSPAVRVQETLDIAMAAMGDTAPKKRLDDRLLYLATPENLADVAARHAGDCDGLLLVAHNPGLADFVLERVPDNDENPLREEVAIKYPTGAFSLLEFDIADWSELPEAEGRLVTLVRPRDIDATLGPGFD